MTNNKKIIDLQQAKLKAYYEKEGLEDLRLQPDGVQYTEFLTITKYLDLVLPKNCRVLDPCAGTGAYSFYLADQGHQVVAGDLFEKNLNTLIAKAQTRLKVNPISKPLEETYLGDVRDLSRFKPASFDAVLCMGALYHLLTESDRLKAVTECLKILKPGGIFVATYINRLGAIACNFSGDVDDLNEILDFLKNGREGVFYSHTPTAIEEMLNPLPLKPLYHIGADGIGYLLNGVSHTISHTGLIKWRQFHFATCEMKEILGYSYHGAYFGQKI